MDSATAAHWMLAAVVIAAATAAEAAEVATVAAAQTSAAGAERARESMPGPPPCVARLDGATVDEQLDCLERLRAAGFLAGFDLDRMIELFGSSRWTAPADRPRPVSPDLVFADHDGTLGTLSELVDRPALITFFCTRCPRGGECAATVARLATLQRRLQADGLGRYVLLLAVTYEPHLDSPERLKRFAAARGMALGTGARALRLDPERQGELLDELAIEVSYTAGRVDDHQVELALLDGRGRLVRKYDTENWTPPAVLADLLRLLAER